MDAEVPYPSEVGSKDETNDHRLKSVFDDISRGNLIEKSRREFEMLGDLGQMCAELGHDMFSRQ
jgi:hypothetical protein